MPVTVRNRARLRTSKGTVGRGFSPTQRQQLKADLLDYGREQVNGRLTFMGTWEGARATFTPIVEEEENVIRLRIRMSGSDYGKLKWRWVSGGTDIRYATMSYDWESKTKIRRLNSGKGSGTLAYVDVSQPREGIEAREIDEHLRDTLEPEFVLMIRKKFRRPMAISSWAGVTKADGKGIQNPG